MALMTYEDWRKKTYLRTRRRSKELKGVDQALDFKEFYGNGRFARLGGQGGRRPLHKLLEVGQQVAIVIIFRQTKPVNQLLECIFVPWRGEIPEMTIGLVIANILKIRIYQLSMPLVHWLKRFIKKPKDMRKRKDKYSPVYLWSQIVT